MKNNTNPEFKFKAAKNKVIPENNKVIASVLFLPKNEYSLSNTVMIPDENSGNVTYKMLINP